MASRILAQILVAGGTAVLRAATQAWQQALQNAHRSGVAAETLKQATRAGQLTAAEARMILGVNEGAPWPEVVKRYKHLFEVNEKQGSFYLQSKVFRAWEQLEQEYSAMGLKTPDGDTGTGAAGPQQPPSQHQRQQQPDQQQR